MARVRPFPAVTYGRSGPDITPLTAPPYDVISEEERERLLAGDARNVVALELAEGPLDPALPGNRYETAGHRWTSWLADGTLVREPRPAIYVLEQSFTHEGRQVRRRGLVAAVGLEPFEAGIILPHERTLPKALTDRLELLRATRANFSQILGLYSDPERITDPLLEAASGPPLVAATADDGVRSKVWALDDAEHIAAAADVFRDQQLFIADGHHRYSTALSYRDERRAAGSADGDGFVMMALVNMDDPDLLVLPTHRVADAPDGFEAAAFLSALAERFDVTALGSEHPSEALAATSDRASFLLRVRGDQGVYLVRLRDDVDPRAAMTVDASPAWKGLDVAVLQELVLDPLLDIHPDRPATLDRLAFVKDAHEAMRMSADHDAVFVLNPTRMDQLRTVALGGETMPQKSTYFYPKLLSGLLFRSLD